MHDPPAPLVGANGCGEHHVLLIDKLPSSYITVKYPLQSLDPKNLVKTTGAFGFLGPWPGQSLGLFYGMLSTCNFVGRNVRGKV